jgi:hypothetical protein
LYGDDGNKTRISGLLSIDPENMDKIQPPMEPMDPNLKSRINLLLQQYILHCITSESLFDERVYTFLLRMGADPTEIIEVLLYRLKLNFLSETTDDKPRFDKMFQIVKKVLQHPQTSFQGFIQKKYDQILFFDKFYGNPTDTDDEIKVNQTLKKELHQIRQLYRKKMSTSIRQVLFGDEDTTLRRKKLVARRNIILPYTQSIKQMKKTQQQMIRLNMLVPELINVDADLSPESILQFLLDIGADPNHSFIKGTKKTLLNFLLDYLYQNWYDVFEQQQQQQTQKDKNDRKTSIKKNFLPRTKMLLQNKFTTKDNIDDYQKLMSIESHDQLDQIRDLIGKLPSV